MIINPFYKYRGEYYVPDNNYTSIEIPKNSIILYKSDECITKQCSKAICYRNVL